MLNVKVLLSGTFFLSLCALPSAIAAEKPGAARLPQAPAPQQSALSVLAGEVVSVEGTVFVRQDGKSSGGNLTPAKPGDPIRTGDVVNTSSNGKIKILMKDKSIVDLGPSALFKVDGFKPGTGTDRQIDVSMMYGTLRTAVTQKLTGQGRFKVRTPSATMGVRGTEFIVKSDVKSLKEVSHSINNPDKPLPPSLAGKSPDGKAAPAAEAKTEVTVLQGRVDVAAKEPEKKSDSGRGPASESPKVVSLTAGTQLTTKQGDSAPAKPVTLNTQQLSSLSSQAKVTDNTFTKAVVIDTSGGSSNSSSGPSGGGDRSPASSGGASSAASSAAGAATLAVLASAVSMPAPPPVSVSDIGIAGTFGGNQVLDRPQQVNTLGVNRKLRVIIVK